MTLVLPPKFQAHWDIVSPLLMIHNERDYNAAIERLDGLLNEVGDDERHPLFSLVDTLGTLIHAYEGVKYQLPTQTGAEVLRFLMDEHGLAQSELPEIGSQGVVSEVLNGKRDLNVRQVRALAKRFGVSPAALV